MASGVAVDGREEMPMLLRPAGSDPALLRPDLTLEVLVDRDCGLTAHLVVEVTQVGGVLSVVKKAVERQGAGVGGSQPAPDQDDGDQPPFGGGPAVEVRWSLNLGHHVLGQPAGQPGWARGKVTREEQRRGRQGVIPAVLADGLEERSRRCDSVLSCSMTQ